MLPDSANPPSVKIRHHSEMTPNRRIFLNIVATYGRSLYAPIRERFCGRRTLMAVGVMA